MAKKALSKKSKLLRRFMELDLSHDTVMMVARPLGKLPDMSPERETVAAELLEKLKTCKTEEEVIQKFSDQTKQKSL